MGEPTNPTTSAGPQDKSPAEADTRKRPRKAFSLRRVAVLLVMLLAVVAGVLGVGGCMVMSMPGESYEGAFTPLTADEADTRDQLITHVTALAGDIGARHFLREGSLPRAIDYIRSQLEGGGYEVRSLDYTVTSRREPVTATNLEATLPGTDRASEILVVGAHYDTVVNTPGADDNASGVAVLLELARLMAGRPRSRTVRFVAFSTEEPPWFQTDEMGSLVYARQCRERGDDIRGMISLETMGFYTREPETQRYPTPMIEPFYPDSGHFLAFVADFGSRGFVRECIGSFREHAQFPTRGIAAPPGMSGIGFSDHWSFRQCDYPAIMLTDTAMLRYDAYHRPEDTPDRLDYPRLARITRGLLRMMDDLAGSATSG